MKIKGNLSTREYLRIEDIYVGECFQFLDTDTLYMRVSNDCYVSMEDGELYDEDNSLRNKPVREINTTLVIGEAKE